MENKGLVPYNYSAQVKASNKFIYAMKLVWQA
jgi:hypothetical protein